MHSIRFVSCLIIVFILDSCHYSGKTIEVNLNSSFEENISLYDLFERVDVIPLEASKDTCLLLNGRYKYAFGDDYFAILACFGDYSIWLFDYNGSFVNRINYQGDGHGLYKMAYDILFDEQTALFVVLDPTGKVLRYSASDFSFIDELSYLGSITAGHYLGSLGDNCYVIYSRSDEYLLHRCSFSDQTVSPIKISYPKWLVQSPMMSAISPFCRYGEQTIYMFGLDGQLFRFGDKGLFPYIRWELGDHQLNAQSIPKGKMPGFYIRWMNINSYHYATAFSFLQETERFILLFFYYRNIPHTLMYEKGEDRVHVFYQTKEGVRIAPGYYHNSCIYQPILNSQIGWFVPSNSEDIIPQTEYALLRYVLK